MGLLALWLMIGAQAFAQAGPPDACSYEFHREIQTFPHCARRDAGGGLHVEHSHLRRMAYDRYGLAAVFAGTWHYVTRTGRSAAVMPLDNGADPFSDGLARAPSNGKIGYIDRKLNLVIPALFDGAFPFAHGVAVVCMGCRKVPDDEHSSYVGGNWGCIDRHGNLVVALHPAAGYSAGAPRKKAS
jgi:hypothetical protein